MCATCAQTESGTDVTRRVTGKGVWRGVGVRIGRSVGGRGVGKGGTY